MRGSDKFKHDYRELTVYLPNPIPSFLLTSNPGKDRAPAPADVFYGRGQSI